MDNVLPLASRRCPDNIDMFLESEDVQVRSCNKGGGTGQEQGQLLVCRAAALGCGSRWGGRADLVGMR